MDRSKAQKVKQLWSNIKCSVRGFHRISVYDRKCIDCGYEREKKNDQPDLGSGY
jgi:hypothetical protein